jgi:hypothetical protein
MVLPCGWTALIAPTDLASVSRLLAEALTKGSLQMGFFFVQNPPIRDLFANRIFYADLFSA